MAEIKPAAPKRRIPAAKPESAAAARTPGRRSDAKHSSSMMHVRIEDDLKRDAASTLGRIGLSMPEAIRLFLRRVVIENALPLHPDVPTEKAIRAMDEANAPDLRVFASARELFDDLEDGRRE